MNRKVTCFTSMALAALMAVSPVLGSSVTVFAAEPETDTNQIQVDESSTSEPIQVEDGIQVDTDIKDSSDIQVEEEKSPEVSVQVGEKESDSEIAVTKEYKVGTELPVHVSAANPSDADVEMRLYFWDYNDVIPEDKAEWSQVLKDACEDVDVTELQAEDGYSVDLSDSISEFVTWKTDKNDKDEVQSVYLDMTIPAGMTLNTVFHVTNEKAETITMVPVIGDVTGDAVQAVWTEDSITVEAVTEESEQESQASESEESQIVVETDTPADSFLSVYLGDGIESVDSDVEADTSNVKAESTEDDSDSETSDVTVSKDTAELNASDFASMRLVILTDDASVITNDTDVIGQYENVYLLQFTSIQQTMNAYAYYKDKVIAVEPDAVVEAASESEENLNVASEIPMNDEENPVAALNDMSVSEDIQDDQSVIALIDTGVSEHTNVIDRVSVVDDALEGNGHGNEMVDAIVTYNAGAKILSIRAMDNNGFGTVSSLVAAMEYAIEQKVDIINLSLYMKVTLSTSVIEQEILKAIDAGITVVGAAGNSNADAVGFLPGAVEEAYIIGAAKENGARLDSSNFGETVDYNVVASSTSKATALFTGFISANGIDAVDGELNQNHGFIFSTDYVAEDGTHDTTTGEDETVKPIEDTGEVFPVTVNVKGDVEVIFSNLDGTVVKTLSVKDDTVTEDIPMTGVQVEILAPMYHRLAAVSILDASGKKLEDVSLDDVAEDIKGVRNTYFTLDAMQEMNISVETEESEEDVPRLDLISHKYYVESLLCGPDCLEKHVRNEEPVDMETSEIAVTADSDLYKALMAMNSDEDVVAAGLSQMPVAGNSYSGDCTIITENFPNGVSGGGADWTVRFDTGILSGNSAPAFRCADHGAANPRAGTACTYTAKCTSVSGGTANFYILVTPPGYIGAPDDPSHPGWKLGYQRLQVNSSFTLPFGGLSIQKVSGNTTVTNNNSNYSLKGAEYSIYSGGKYVTKIVTDASGIATTSNTALQAGSYTVKETKASPGYSLDSTIYTINVTGGSTASANRKISTEPPKTGTASLKKVSSLSSITNNNNCYSLQGAVYGIWKDKSCSGTPWKTMTTDKNGNASISGLPFGTYYVKETKASKGYELDTQVYTITLTEANSSASLTSIEVPGNDPAGIQITKIWDGDKTSTIPTLEGTQFTIKYYDGYYTKSNLPSTPKRTWVLEVKYVSQTGTYMCGLTDSYLVDSLSDDLYKIDGVPTLPLGTITIQETKSAPGYTLNGYLTDKDGNKVSTDSEIYVSQIKDSTSGVFLAGGNEFHGYNIPKFGKIILKKYDSDGKSPLEGVTFKMVGETVDDVYTATTNAKGEVVFDNLYPDVYTITETKTVNGHNLLKEPLVVEVPMRVTEDYIEKYNVDRDSVTYDPADDIYYIHEFTYEITNDVTFKMPMAGGFTDAVVFAPLIAGMGILSGIGAVTLRKKKKK